MLTMTEKPTREDFMARFLWGAFFLSTSSLALWIVSSSFRPRTDTELVLILIFFGLQPFGAFWMIAHAIRNQPGPFKYVLVSFVPYAFVWYFIQHAKGSRISHGGRA